MANHEEIIIVRETPPGVEKQVNEIIIERGAGAIGGVTENTNHRLGDGSDHDDVAFNSAFVDPGGYNASPEVNPVELTDIISLERPASAYIKVKATIAGIYSLFKSLFKTIDYANPITLTGAISPSNGDFYTTNSLLVTLTGSGGEKFWPAGGATSRIIWGDGGGADLPSVIDPVNLGVGDIFEIALDDGESRKMRYDGTDFHKIGGVEIPMRFSADTDTKQVFTSISGWNAVTLEDENFDIGSVFVNSLFTPKRDSEWALLAMLGIKAETGEVLDRALIALGESGSPTVIFLDTRPDASIADTPLRASGARLVKSQVTAGTDYQTLVLASNAGLTGDFEVLGDSTPARTTMSGVEVVPW